MNFQRLGLTVYVLHATVILGQTGKEPTLAGFQAFLFNAKTGALSRDILHDPKPELGNIPIGEFASDATLVTVKIRVGKGARTLRVHLVAIESGKSQFSVKQTPDRDRVLLDKTEPLGLANSDGFTYVGFWLPGTGCREIRLKAQLTGGGSTAAISEVIPFTCYE
jgi:hypothetical protein